MENDGILELLKAAWDSLTEEQKAKAKECKTAEELVELAGREGIELPDELLDAASGGVIVDIKGTGTWSVFDDSGDFITNVGSKKEAEAVARTHHVRTDEVTTAGLNRIRQEAEMNKSYC